MKRNTVAAFLGLAFLLLLFTAGAVVMAQTSAGYHLEQHVIGSGGGAASSASYQISGTIGQSVASQPVSGSASFKVTSGYWYGNAPSIYLPTILKN